MMTSGVATPKHASNNIITVMAIPAMNPANRPAPIAFHMENGFAVFTPGDF
jgi:hypothetical protein